jgi:hypothetical protein
VSAAIFDNNSRGFAIQDRTRAQDLNAASGVFKDTEATSANWERVPRTQQGPNTNIKTNYSLEFQKGVAINYMSDIVFEFITKD